MLSVPVRHRLPPRRRPYSSHSPDPLDRSRRARRQAKAGPWLRPATCGRTPPSLAVGESKAALDARPCSRERDTRAVQCTEPGGSRQEFLRFRQKERSRRPAQPCGPKPDSLVADRAYTEEAGFPRSMGLRTVRVCAQRARSARRAGLRLRSCSGGTLNERGRPDGTRGTGIQLWLARSTCR